MITWMNNVNNFQKLRVLLRICLIFCQFQPNITYKSDSYKKTRVYSKAATGIALLKNCSLCQSLLLIKL